MQLFYVYHLIDPRSGEVFYVGKGSGDRIAAHEREARLGSQHPKCDAIRSIWADGKEVRRIKAAFFASEAAAYEFESEEIARIGFESLTNLTSGGGGVRAFYTDRKRPAPVPFDSSEEVARGTLAKVARYLWLKALRRNKALHFMFGAECQHAEAAVLKAVLIPIKRKFGASFISSELAWHRRTMAA